eukprot:CAMPEP_0204560192 /NCGR_PEP_ID=MMETSP0661-20131031/32474_1 /ASSEMBLY_ACC=CAM_ASM_000606 /TAXON_ID=109239 /ORGANISM="Alexandrium margalefi, Strain AMGDE01CS-322" /LENGTH=148 /DNA_ID=CAMNT_0051567497 /DNA_START=67 /DNA_END=510 /DNA_ORIENTATION=-
MPVDLTIAGAMGLKAVAAAKAASAAAKQAAAQAIAMAQNTNLAALQADQAQANLEKYVYGVPVSSVPPAISPVPPAAMHPFPVLPACMAQPGAVAMLELLAPARPPAHAAPPARRRRLVTRSAMAAFLTADPRDAAVDALACGLRAAR